MKLTWSIKRSSRKKWNANDQLVPLNTHQSNAAEQAIHTFKAHFIAILAGVAPDFPRNLCDLLLLQTKLTLNLLWKATLDPSYQHGHTSTASSTTTLYHSDPSVATSSHTKRPGQGTCGTSVVKSSGMLVKRSNTTGATPLWQNPPKRPKSQTQCNSDTITSHSQHHTNGWHCPQRDHTNMRLKQRLYYCM